MAVLGHGPLPSRGVLQRVGWEVSCRDMAPCGVCNLYTTGFISRGRRADACAIRGNRWRNQRCTDLYAQGQLCFAQPPSVAVEPKEWLGWAPAVAGLFNISQASLQVSFEVGIQNSLEPKRKKKGTRKISIKGRRGQREKKWGRNFKIKTNLRTLAQ